MIKKVAQKMIRCSHQNLLKCLLVFCPKVAGGTVAFSNVSPRVSIFSTYPFAPSEPFLLMVMASGVNWDEMNTFSTLQKDGGSSAERWGLHKKKSGDMRARIGDDQETSPVTRRGK